MERQGWCVHRPYRTLNQCKNSHTLISPSLCRFLKLWVLLIGTGNTDAFVFHGGRSVNILQSEAYHEIIEGAKMQSGYSNCNNFCDFLFLKKKILPEAILGSNYRKRISISNSHSLLISSETKTVLYLRDRKQISRKGLRLWNFVYVHMETGDEMLFK